MDFTAKFDQNSSVKLRICVVGAGAAGICSARRIMEELPEAEVSVFEQGDQVGGTWVFSEEHTLESHSAMYADLRTNIPKEIMTFCDFPFASVDFPLGQDPADSFPRHEVVLAYLQRFAKPVRHLIRFNSKICAIEPIDRGIVQNGEKGRRWKVIYEQIPSKNRISEDFDAVFVCTGHYWAPRLPEFACKLRKTQWMHSRGFRHAHHFAGMRVAVVGARLSGLEIAMQLVEHAEKVYLVNSAQNPAVNQHIPSNLVELNGTRVVDVSEDGGLVLTGGQLLDQPLDFVLFCTGYRFCFPFLVQSAHSSVVFCDGNFVSPLVAHVAHAQHISSLFFIGLNLMVAPFPCMDVQTHFAIALLKHRIPTETEETRQFTPEGAELWERQRIRGLLECNVPLKYYHRLGPEQWEYYDRLNSLSGFKGFPKVVESVYKYNVRQKDKDPRSYRNIRYRLVDGQNFAVEGSDEQGLRSDSDGH